MLNAKSFVTLSMLDLEDLLTEEQVGALLHVKPGTLRNWRSKGIGPAYIKSGRHPLYPKKGLLQFAKDQLVQPKGRGAATEVSTSPGSEERHQEVR